MLSRTGAITVYSGTKRTGRRCVRLAIITRQERDSKMKVKIEFVRYLCRQIAMINSVDLQDITFYENGEKVDITCDIRDDFALTGLNNTDFVTSGFYKR